MRPPPTRFKAMGYYVYILESEQDGSYYVGYASDLEGRLSRHNGGRSPYTRGKLPWKLVYHEMHPSRGEAMHREQEIKRKKSHAYIERLVRASRA